MPGLLLGLPNPCHPVRERVLPCQASRAAFVAPPPVKMLLEAVLDMNFTAATHNKIQNVTTPKVTHMNVSPAFVPKAPSASHTAERSRQSAPPAALDQDDQNQEQGHERQENAEQDIHRRLLPC